MIWHNATAAEVEMELKTNRVTGLTSAEAAQRKQQYGENSLKKKKKVSMSEEELFLMRKLYLWKMNEKPF